MCFGRNKPLFRVFSTIKLCSPQIPHVYSKRLCCPCRFSVLALSPLSKVVSKLPLRHDYSKAATTPIALLIGGVNSLHVCRCVLTGCTIIKIIIYFYSYVVIKSLWISQSGFHRWANGVSVGVAPINVLKFCDVFCHYLNLLTVCSPIKAKFRSRAFTCGNIQILTLPYCYSFVWRFLKCMNGCCSSKDKKVIRFLIFRKIGFLNFAILKSSPNSETGTKIKKCLQ